MPIDEKLRRFAKFADGDIQRMLERQHSWTRDFDEIQFNPSMGLVGFAKLGTCLWKAHVEHIGNYYPDIGMFRWTWALRSPTARSTRVDAVLREGEKFGMEQLTSNHVSNLEDPDATLLANLAAHLAKAEGVLRMEEGEHFAYYALYEAPENTIPPPRGLSVPPPGKAPSTRPSDPFGSAPPPPIPPLPKPSRAPSASAPAPRTSSRPPPAPARLPTSPPTPQSFAPPARPIREPGRLLLGPLLQQGLADVAAAVPGGYTHAMLLVNVSRGETRGQFFVVLVAVDTSGELRAPEPSPATMQVAAQFIKDDLTDGNGPWRRLVVRVVPSVTGGLGAAVEVT